jgi:hypothetical protein
MFVSVSRSKHVQKRKLLPKNVKAKSQQQNQKRSIFFFCEKNTKMVQMRAFSQFGAFARGCRKAVKHSTSQMSPTLVLNQRQPGLFLVDNNKTPE